MDVTTFVGNLGSGLLTLILTGFALRVALEWIVYAGGVAANLKARYWRPAIRRRERKSADMIARWVAMGCSEGEARATFPPSSFIPRRLPEKPFHGVEGVAAIGGKWPALVASLAWLYVLAVG